MKILLYTQFAIFWETRGHYIQVQFLILEGTIRGQFCSTNTKTNTKIVTQDEVLQKKKATPTWGSSNY